MAIGDNYRRLAPDDQLIFNASGGVAGIRSGRSTGAEGRMLSAATADAVQSLVSGAGIPGLFARPYRLATWGQERASFESSAPELIGNARHTDIRSPFWMCAARGDMIPAADYGCLAGTSSNQVANWNLVARSEGKTINSLYSKANQIDMVFMTYGGSDIVAGNGTTPTAATLLAYLQANILAIMRAGIPVVFESIYPYIDTALYRNVASGWTAQGSGTAAQKQAICDDLNTQLQAWLANFPHQAVFVDVATPLKDGGQYLSKKYAIDGIELNRRGAQLCGEMSAAASLALLPAKRAQYFGKLASITPELIALTPTGFTDYTTAAATNGTVSWGTPSVGVDSTYGPYFEITGTCSAITGPTAFNITAVTWAAGVLQFTVAAHKLMPTQNVVATGLSGSIAGAMTGPWEITTSDSETQFSVALAADPGTITIAGSPPSSSATVVLQEASAQFNLLANVIRQNGTPATGIALAAGDMLESSAWVSADNGSGGAPNICSMSMRQRVFYQAGTNPTNGQAYQISDGGINVPTNMGLKQQRAFGPFRYTTPKMQLSNTSGVAANISNASGVQLQFSAYFNATGATRFRVYAPSMRVVQAGPIIISTPATAVAYTNKYPVPIRVLVGVNGATISAATVRRADTINEYPAGVTSGGSVTLAPNDSLTLTYTVATPTMTGFMDVVL